MDLGSRALRRLTNNLAIDTEPFWGKDGSTLYFTWTVAASRRSTR